MLPGVLPGVLLGAVIALAGCSAEPSPAPAHPSTASTGPSAAKTSSSASTGCGKTTPVGGRIEARAHGIALDYLLTLPAGFPNTEPAPLVLNFHGLGSNAVQQDAYTRLPIAGSNLGYVIATPESASGLPGWIIPGFGKGRLKDQQIEIRAARALLDHLESTVCVDTAREFATGMSNGAGMAAALVCGLGGRLAAVAPVSGITIAQPCAHPRPTSIITFHGTADQVVPFGGGQVSLGTRVQGFQVPVWLRSIRLPGFETTLGRWTRAMGCGHAAKGRPASDVTLRTFRCDGGATVEAYVVEGGGHTWPGGIRLDSLGRTAKLDATGLILQAFGRHAARR